MPLIKKFHDAEIEPVLEAVRSIVRKLPQRANRVRIPPGLSPDQVYYIEHGHYPPRKEKPRKPIRKFDLEDRQ
jgi:hypothetical protein